MAWMEFLVLKLRAQKEIEALLLRGEKKRTLSLHCHKLFESLN